MKINIERPFNLLDISKGKQVLIVLNDNSQIRGELLSFDINLNMVLDHAFIIDDNETNLGLIFIRGQSIKFLSSGVKF